MNRGGAIPALARSRPPELALVPAQEGNHRPTLRLCEAQVRSPSPGIRGASYGLDELISPQADTLFKVDDEAGLGQ